MKRRTRNKKNKFITKFLNTISICFMAVVMLVGMRVYSASENSLTFAQISDAHYSSATSNTSYRLTAESGELLDDAIKQVNEAPEVNFVMFTGDLINKPYQKELMKFFSYANKLNAPWYAVLGNHDVCIGGYLTKKVYWDMLNSHNKNFSFTKPYYSFIPKKGYKVIALDPIIDTKITSNGYIPKEQLKWLDKELSKSKNSTVLIFLHMPVVEPMHSESHMLLNENEVRKILSKYKNPIGVFTGHYHTTKITQIGNVLYVSTPSLVSYPNSFRIVKVTTLKNKVVFDIKFKETRYAEVQRRAKMMAFGSRTYYGNELDRSGTFTIKK